MKKRQLQILELLNQNTEVSVAVLAQKLKVSEVTIRKDLNELESRDLLVRQHGFAILKNINDIDYRLAFNYNIKNKIAKKALELISDGDKIMIESGSTCTLLAHEIAEQRKNVSIVTNSVYIANYMRSHPHIQVFLLGGDFQHDSQVTVGPITKLCANSFVVKYLFVGTDGYREGQGFMGANHLRVEATRNMAESAEQVVVLTSSEKFKQLGFVHQFASHELGIVITDKKIKKEFKDSLKEDGVQVVEVS